MLSRSEFMRQWIDPRRDIDHECGYPKGHVGVDEYQALYDWEAIAAKVVNILPDHSWKVQPGVFESEDENETTEFEEAFNLLGQQLHGEESFYQDQAGSILWEYLHHVDVLSGIGQYGVLFLAFDDEAELSEPAQPGTKANPRRLLFMRAFSEANATITKFETNRLSPRFGQPLEYRLKFSTPVDNGDGVVSSQDVKVHWSRIIHVADNVLSNEIFGTPRLKPVLRRILDLRKLYGGSAEMYWAGALPGWAFSTLPQLGGNAKINVDQIRATMENYANSLQRFIAMAGMDVKSMAPQVVDPKTQIEVQLDAICIKIDVPKRIFMGSERGELASTQDKEEWNNRIHHRQVFHITPRIVVPFVNRLILLGVLPKPKGFSVHWPDLSAYSDDQIATVAVKKTNALANYVRNGVNDVMVLLDFLTKIIGLKQSEAQAVIENLKNRKPDDPANPIFRISLTSTSANGDGDGISRRNGDDNGDDDDPDGLRDGTNQDGARVKSDGRMRNRRQDNGDV
jgi:hypothetical protein